MTETAKTQLPASGRPLARRSVLAGAASGAVGLLAACGSSGSSNKNTSGGGQKTTSSAKVTENITLHYWNWLPEMDKAVAVFNKAHPHIHLVSESVEPATQGAYPKMLAAVKAGKPPELAHVEYIVLPQFLTAGALTDISQYAQSAQSKFVPWQWAECVFGGKVYSIPWASGPMGLFYREDLYKQYGISVPKTWDDFKTAAQKVRQQTSKVYMTSFGATMASVLAGLAWQAGARWFQTKGGKWVIDVDGSDTMKVANYWQSLLDDKLVSTVVFQSNAYWKALQQGTIMTMVGANWDDALISGNVKNTKGKWRAALLPQWSAGEHESANYGGSSTAVLKGCKYPKEAVDAAIWLNTNANSVNAMTLGGAGWPASATGAKVPALNQPAPFFGNQVYQQVFATSDAHISETWKWGPTSEQTLSHIDDVLEQVVTGKATVADAVKKAQTETINDMKAKGLPVASA